MVTLPVFPVRAIMGELDGKFFVGSYWGCLDHIDGISMNGELAVVVAGGKVLMEEIAVRLYVTSSID